MVFHVGCASHRNTPAKTNPNGTRMRRATFCHVVRSSCPFAHTFTLSSSARNSWSAASTTSSVVICINPVSVFLCREWSFLLEGCRSTREAVPYGPFRTGSVGPYSPTTGLSSAAARCSGPVSPAITTAARRTSAIICVTEHATSIAAPSLDSTTRLPSSSSVDAAFTSVRIPRASQFHRYCTVPLRRPLLCSPARRRCDQSKWFAALGQ